MKRAHSQESDRDSDRLRNLSAPENVSGTNNDIKIAQFLLNASKFAHHQQIVFHSHHTSCHSHLGSIHSIHWALPHFIRQFQHRYKSQQIVKRIDTSHQPQKKSSHHKPLSESREKSLSQLKIEYLAFIQIKFSRWYTSTSKQKYLNSLVP